MAVYNESAKADTQRNHPGPFPGFNLDWAKLKNFWAQSVRLSFVVKFRQRKKVLHYSNILHNPLHRNNSI